jgi:hypothetical protein
MSRHCSMFKECLVYFSMHLGVPFIAPRQLGAVWVLFGRLWLPSIHGRTGQWTVRVSLLFLAKPTVVSHWSYGTPDSLGRPSDRWLGHVSPADRAVDRWLGARLTHWTIWWIIVVAPLAFSRERPVHRGASLGTRHCPVHTGQSSAHRTVQCTNSIYLNLRRFLALSRIMLVPKAIC